MQPWRLKFPVYHQALNKHTPDPLIIQFWETSVCKYPNKGETHLHNPQTSPRPWSIIGQLKITENVLQFSFKMQRGPRPSLAMASHYGAISNSVFVNKLLKMCSRIILRMSWVSGCGGGTVLVAQQQQQQHLLTQELSCWCQCLSLSPASSSIWW